ncbi:Arf-GAP with SH3 domain, ANK repeat and PH domain-containing protein 1 [Cichlidogyrus casuarinus]|uniref:Arf-GAP with SH3 domain, ANK repeat and PH domain-containing protein 1 n=1 Tax=Cichlidogyrus casuarinus TaxID=1844966 RepID=A0ABD2Q4U1_9PLAT
MQRPPVLAATTYQTQPPITMNVSQAYGTQKNGYLLKKSDGKVKRVWQRRRVHIADGRLSLFHADESKLPVQLMLLTYNRTYNFQAEDDRDYEE